MTSKPTPGPWTKEYTKGKAGTLVTSDDKHVATVYGGPADASLISAAPEMLTLLQDVRDMLERPKSIAAIRERARALLAKVEGGES